MLVTFGARKRPDDEDDMSELRDIPRVPGPFVRKPLRDSENDRIKFLTNVHRDHGDVVRARHGVFEVVMSADADFSHEVLVEKADAFVKGYGLSVFMRPMLGNGLLTSEGSFHRRSAR